MTQLLAVGPWSRENEVIFIYTNWKGVERERRATMLNLFWGSNEWHKEPQWLIEGWDAEKKARRTYALKDITNVRRPDDRLEDRE